MKLEVKTTRFGHHFQPNKEEREKKKTTRHIIILLIIFIILALALTIVIAIKTRNYVTNFAINETVDSMWIGSVASYLGGTLGGIFSGVFAFLGVFYTIKYYKESDDKKEKVAIQPFLMVKQGTNKEPTKGFTLGTLGRPESTTDATEKIKVSIKNIGNGFATLLVFRTESGPLGGYGYNQVLSKNESTELFFMVEPLSLEDSLNFEIQYIDAMRNEYVQRYAISRQNGVIDIESGYPIFIKQT